jgi:peroxiredoxin
MAGIMLSVASASCISLFKELSYMQTHSGRNRLTYILIAIIILLAAAIVGLLYENHRLDAMINTPKSYQHMVTPDSLAVSFSTVDIEGNKVDLNYHPEGPHTLIFWFGTFCRQCADNVEIWNRICGNSDSTNLRCYGMSTGDLDEVKQFAEKHNVNFSVIPVRSRLVIDSYKGNVLPQTVLISPEGIIQGVWPGIINRDQEDIILAMLGKH